MPQTTHRPATRRRPAPIAPCVRSKSDGGDGVRTATPDYDPEWLHPCTHARSDELPCAGCGLCAPCQSGRERQDEDVGCTATVEATNGPTPRHMRSSAACYVSSCSREAPVELGPARPDGGWYSCRIAQGNVQSNYFPWVTRRSRIQLPSVAAMGDPADLPLRSVAAGLARPPHGHVKGERSQKQGLS